MLSGPSGRQATSTGLKVFISYRRLSPAGVHSALACAVRARALRVRIFLIAEKWSGKRGQKAEREQQAEAGQVIVHGYPYGVFGLGLCSWRSLAAMTMSDVGRLSGVRSRV